MPVHKGRSGAQTKIRKLNLQPPRHSAEHSQCVTGRERKRELYNDP